MANGPDRRRAAALRYDPADGAPKLVASGAGAVADRIVALAQAHDVPLWPDPALAGSLAALELGSEIPPELYEAVAAILAHLYRLERQQAALRGGGTPEVSR